MSAFTSANGPNKVKLGNFVKKLSVDVTHVVRLNKAGKRVPRIKLILVIKLAAEIYRLVRMSFSQSLLSVNL